MPVLHQLTTLKLASFLLVANRIMKHANRLQVFDIVTKEVMLQLFLDVLRKKEKRCERCLPSCKW